MKSFIKCLLIFRVKKGTELILFYASLCCLFCKRQDTHKKEICQPLGIM